MILMKTCGLLILAASTFPLRLISGIDLVFRDMDFEYHRLITFSTCIIIGAIEFNQLHFSGNGNDSHVTCQSAAIVYLRHGIIFDLLIQHQSMNISRWVEDHGLQYNPAISHSSQAP